MQGTAFLDADNVSVSGRTTTSRGRTPRSRGARLNGVQGGELLPNGSKGSADRRGYGVGDHRYGPSKGRRWTQYRNRPSRRVKRSHGTANSQRQKRGDDCRRSSSKVRSKDWNARSRDGRAISRFGYV